MRRGALAQLAFAGEEVLSGDPPASGPQLRNGTNGGDQGHNKESEVEAQLNHMETHDGSNAAGIGGVQRPEAFQGLDLYDPFNE